MSPDYQMLLSRDKEILKARYDNTPIALLDRHFFLSAEWKEKMILWNSFIGIRDNLTGPEQENFIIEMLINEFGGLTFSEVELALKMNLLGEFGDIIEHYNYFDVRYLTQIIRAYKIKRLQADTKYKEICHRMQYLPAPMPDQQTADYHSGRATYRKYKDWLQGNPVICLHVDYKFLHRIGVVVDNPEQEKEALLMVQENMQHEMEDDISNPQQIGSIFGKVDVLEIKVMDRVHAYIVLELFQKVKDEAIDFQHLLRTAIHTLHGRERE